MSTRIAYFGGEPLGAPTLAALIAAGYTPDLVVCNPDRPAGRGRLLTPPPVKVLAAKHNLPVWQPEHITKTDTALTGQWDLFIVVAYNKILPPWLIDVPQHKTINIHPSLLPKLRGASPIRSAILRDEPQNVGVTIMQMDNEMDHGPILVQKPLPIDTTTWPPSGPELDRALTELGAQLLIDTLPGYLAGTITPVEQDHEQATYCSKLTKAMAELIIDPYNLPRGEMALQTYRTIQAFRGIGDAWFMCDNVRYKIKAAHLDGEQLIIDSVVPAGQSEKTFTTVFPAST